LFSGIDAYKKALNRLNIKHETINYCEIDEKTSKAFNVLYNIPEDLNLTDITKVDETKLKDFDLLTYSPPCQSFSRAGKELGFEDERGVLFFDALRIIKYKQPKYCIMENVKGLTQKKFINEFDIMLEELNKSGYNNYYKILNAKDYGIPQNRERIFVVSIRKDIDDGEFKFPQPIKNGKLLKDLLELDAELPILHNIYGGFKEKEPRIFNEYSPTIRTSKGGGHIPSVYILEDFYKNRLTREYENYSPTLRSGRKGLKIVNGKMTRLLTTLEAFRLMSFDDEDYFKLKEAGFSDTQLYKMAGNSIVVRVLEEIFNSLFR